MSDKMFRESIEDWNGIECWEKCKFKETELIFPGQQ